MSKPPKSTPHSDIDGINQDERRNVDSVIEAEQDSEDLKNAAENSAARPGHSDEKSRDDRTL